MRRRHPTTKSTAQQEAYERNFKILRLRGMHAAFNTLDSFTEHERKIGQDLINRALIRMGARPEIIEPILVTRLLGV